MNNISNRNLLSLKDLIFWKEQTAALFSTFGKNSVKLVKHVLEDTIK